MNHKESANMLWLEPCNIMEASVDIVERMVVAWHLATQQNTCSWFTHAGTARESEEFGSPAMPANAASTSSTPDLVALAADASRQPTTDSSPTESTCRTTPQCF